MELLTYLSSLSIPNLFSRMPAAAAQGIIWGIMALGVYITFRLLNVSDLTVDGSFATGGAVTFRFSFRVHTPTSRHFFILSLVIGTAFPLPPHHKTRSYSMKPAGQQYIHTVAPPA